jgi:orotate phosphoribosyltransferase
MHDRLAADVEDVVTSGGQVTESCRSLRELGALVEVAVCVIDREAGGKGNLAGIAVELRALFSMSELQASAADTDLGA